MLAEEADRISRCKHQVQRLPRILVFDSCSPRFPLHCRHQLDQLQQEEGEARLEHTNQLHHFLNVQSSGGACARIHRL